MVRVTVEIIPNGDESSKYEVGKLEIINNLSGTKEKGNYDYILNSGNMFVEGKYKGHNRKDGVLPLIKKCLSSNKYKIRSRTLS